MVQSENMSYVSDQTYLILVQVQADYVKLDPVVVSSYLIWIHDLYTLNTCYYLTYNLSVF